jgi:membrane complex biogenesis BtpA family protein
VSDWLQSLFGTAKPIIAMCHLKALPGDPGYDPKLGMDYVVEQARSDLISLQDGGIDAVMFSNESSLPYLTQVDAVTVAAMARVVAELRPALRVPFGVNVLWDPIASLDLAAATGALFVREIFTGVYASDFGLWNTNCGKVIRHQHAIGAQSVRLLFNIVPEAASYLGDRHVADIARSTVFNTRPDALCVSGLTAGSETSSQTLRIVKEAVPDTPVFANTGVRLSNVREQLAIADGVVIATALKIDGYIWNPVDRERVRAFMAQVKEIRAAPRR